MPSTIRAGTRIHYEAVGSGKPVLLLNGFGATTEFWHRAGYVDALRDDHHLLGIDFRGHGRSDRPRDPDAYGIHLDIADAAAVLDAVDVDAVTVAGWSWGGYVALGLAALHPERVLAVLPIGASGRYGRFSDLTADYSWFEGWAQRFERQGLRWFADDLASQGHQGWIRDLIAQNDHLAWAAWWRGQLREVPVGTRLADLTLPVVYVAGELELPFLDFPDPLVPPSAVLHVVPALNHVETFLRADVIAPRIRELAAIAGAGRRRRMATRTASRVPVEALDRDVDS